MGKNNPRASFLVKFFMRHFLAPRKIFGKAEEMWEKDCTMGALKATEMDLKKRYMRSCIYEIELYPILCDYLYSYFPFVFKMGVGEDVSVGEEKRARR